MAQQDPTESRFNMDVVVCSNLRKSLHPKRSQVQHYMLTMDVVLGGVVPYVMRYMALLKLKASISFPSIIPKSTQIYSLFTNLAFYITLTMFYYIVQG